jgi:nucleotide-binding universal stress UspA family protein
MIDSATARQTASDARILDLPRLKASIGRAASQGDIAMYKHILVPTDGSTLSNKAARAAAKLARDTGARLTAIYAIPPLGQPMVLDGFAYDTGYSQEAYEKDMRRYADKALSKVKAEAAANEVKCDAISVIEGNPWEAIVKAARTKKCDLIVMASHGRRGIQGVLLGSETTKVLTHSKTPVLVCR